MMNIPWLFIDAAAEEGFMGFYLVQPSGCVESFSIPLPHKLANCLHQQTAELLCYKYAVKIAKKFDIPELVVIGDNLAGSFSMKKFSSGVNQSLRSKILRQISALYAEYWVSLFFGIPPWLH